MFLSIITVTRNNREGLSRTKPSIDTQKCRDFEWIIIDGDSQDGTKHDLTDYEAIAVPEPDKGIYDAMNKGLDRAKGEYVIFLNAGDCLADGDVLQRIQIAATDTKPDFLYGDAFEGQSLHHKPARSHIKYRQGMFTHHQAMLYRRVTLSTMRYDLRYRIASDYDLTCRFLNKNTSSLYLPFPVCIFEEGGLSQLNAKAGRAEQFIIRRRNKLLSLPQNILLYFLQAALWQLRFHMPKLYWKLKSIKTING